MRMNDTRLLRRLTRKLWQDSSPDADAASSETNEGPTLVATTEEAEELSTDAEENNVPSEAESTMSGNASDGPGSKTSSTDESGEAAKESIEREKLIADEIAPAVETASAGQGNVLPVVLIVIGVIVGVVLIAAVISMLLKGGASAAGAGGSSGAQPALEQAPLNDVQAQRVAQMDW